MRKRKGEFCVLRKKKGTKRKPKKARHRPKNAFALPHEQDKTHFSSLLFSSLIYHSLPILSHASFPSLSQTTIMKRRTKLLHTSFSFSPSTHNPHQQHKLTFSPSHAAPTRPELLTFLRNFESSGLQCNFALPTFLFC
ncbi:hypothetical protein PHAVU_002G007700 [Phaseolus vulgaris]|uniref:Uncharacterized protein n=1 Tax=Phaseolus vulgaris TaxID=3885 RepID=V7CEX4_PHAVU|nr:hypothetical protein PHAVU_002G007700g [Phaseolus vulgaris]ESW28669.1 hypothetical protein PHAVU_002G007700g [Phaseolus vulgaris]